MADEVKQSISAEPIIAKVGIEFGADGIASQVTVTSPDNKPVSYPVVNLARYLNKTNINSNEWENDCKTIGQILHQYGFLLVHDPRVNEAENDKFIDLLEKYYDQPESARMPDVRKEYHYQVGTTPSGIEKARNHCEKVAKYDGADKPWTECPPDYDPKSRFFWRMGEIPPQTEFPQLNMDPVIPKSFEKEWPLVMNTWGSLILSTVLTVSEMAAVGYNLPANTFTNLLKYGPHLLAPTGSDLNTWNDVGTVFAKFHYDLNFMTIHGRSRFPGLFVWSRDGKKIPVKVPPNCLLLQAGKQFEWLTGGHVLAGFHEVVVTTETKAAAVKAKEAGRSLWRISSTMFSHVASDNTLQPIAHFGNPEALRNYPPTKAGKQVQEELNAIKLGVSEDEPVVTMA